jgi:hypothetical protein
MNDSLMALAVVAAVILAVGGIVWRVRRSSGILQKWAAAGGYELLQIERRFLRRGGFWWRTSEYQDVFRVLVRDSAGRERAGFVRVGGWFLGLWSDDASVQWDDEQ